MSVSIIYTTKEGQQGYVPNEPTYHHKINEILEWPGSDPPVPEVTELLSRVVSIYDVPSVETTKFVGAEEAREFYGVLLSIWEPDKLTIVTESETFEFTEAVDDRRADNKV
jgi:hypothetical protein